MIINYNTNVKQMQGPASRRNNEMVPPNHDLTYVHTQPFAPTQTQLPIGMQPYASPYDVAAAAASSGYVES